jgi:ATP-dependent Clp protease adaptor protein ClpS
MPLETPQVLPSIDNPELAPSTDDGDTSGSGSDFRVLLYNDEWHVFEEVIDQLIKATRCSVLKAEAIALEAHRRGRAVCFRGARGECHKVCDVLREIRLQCEVDCD